MTEILWHGRGGQGAFTAARLLGAAYVAESDGFYALAFPSFGPERRGAPIRAFTKLSDSPVGDRSQVVRADYSIYLDDTLFTDAAFDELKENGKIILNTRRKVDDERVITLDGTAIAQEILHMPITNTIMLGAFAAFSTSPSIFSSESRQVMRTPNSRSISLILLSKLPNSATAFSILSILMICSVRQDSPDYYHSVNYSIY